MRHVWLRTLVLVASMLVGFGSPDGPPLLRDQATVHAQGPGPQAEFVADIRPGSTSSSPSDMAVFQDALYFSANDGVNGIELWRLGTTGPPTLLADLEPGAGSSSPRLLTVAGDVLYFVAGTTASGRELWRYDGFGPPALVADINPGTATSFPLFLTPLGQDVVFQADDGTGPELFAVGPAGLRLFDIYPNDPSCDPAGGGCGSYPYGLTVHDGVLYFSAVDPVFGGEVYRFDGTTPQRLTNIAQGGSGEFFIGVGTRYLVFAGFNAFGWNQLYSYDIPAGTWAAIATGDPIGGTFPNPFAAFGGRAYFSTNDSATGRELWSTDGTQAGTVRTDLNPGPASSNPQHLISFNGELYFVATDAAVGGEPRAFDGTTLRLVADIYPGPFESAFNGPAILGGYLVFEARHADGRINPWFTDGTTTGMVLKADGGLINPAGDSIDDPHFTFFNGALYFPARDGVTGYELWRVTLTATPPTTTALTSSLNPSIVGDEITLTASVTGSSPTGTMTFMDGLTSLGSVALAGGTASLDISTLGVGNHTLTAKYSGNAGNAPSTAANLVQVVGKVPTSTALQSSSNPSVFWQAVTFTATVTGGAPTGDVTFLDGATALATVTMAGDTASYSTQTLSAGPHTITATYNGDATHDVSASTAVLQTVNQRITTTTLTASPNPSIVGDVVTFSAVVFGGAPTGNVVFSEGAVTLATISIAGGIAEFPTAALGKGTHPITATYVGDANHLGSASGVTQIVNDPAPPAPPVANSQSVTTPEDTAMSIVLGASDANNDPLTFSVVTPPTFGALSGQAPNLLYTPNANYFGPDSFTFKANDGSADSNIATVSITVTPIRDAPVVTNDAYMTLEDTPLSVPTPGVLGNDVNPEASTMIPTVFTGPLNGTLALAPDGSFMYTPTANFFGTDTFTYRVYNGFYFSILATVTVTVNPVNDPPVAGDDSYSTIENTPLTIAHPGVLANDSDPELTALTATLLSGPANGTLTLNPNGSFTYTPSPNFSGADSFTYRASDGAANSSPATVTITVLSRNVTWTATGTLGSRRRYHTATLLLNGKVLVTGGYGQGNGTLAGAEIYDPVAGSWTATGDMGSRRAFHTATLLPNGHVLVAGGEAQGLGIVPTAETYDPATGTWTPTGTFGSLHSRHTATLLANGKVLVVGGYFSSNITFPEAKLYDPATRTWSMTGTLRFGRNYHTATLLPDGQVLVVGGYGDIGALNSAELYNPALGTWSLVANLATNRTGHTATLLATGKVLVTGGGNNGGTLASAELYDPATRTWLPAAALSTTRVLHTATLLASGNVLVAGGTPSSSGAAMSSSELYDPATGQWSSTASLITPRAAHTALALATGKVLAVGGFGGSILSSAEIYGSPAQTSVGAWSPAASLSGQRMSHIATRLADGRVLVAGGTSAFLSGHLSSAEIFDPVTRSWSTTGSLAVARSSPIAVLLPNGKVLVAGGDNTTGAVRSAELYDPTTGTWSTTGSLSTERTAAAATLLTDGRVLVTGGTSTVPTASAEIYNPSTESWFPTGSIPTARTWHSTTLLSNGRVLLSGGYDANGPVRDAAIYNPATGLWTNAGSMSARRYGHTATLLPDGRVLVAGGLGPSGALNSAELFDPVAGKWTKTADMATSRAIHRETLLNNGTLLVTGGLGRILDLSETEVYRPSDGGWSPRGSLATPRSAHTATLLLDGKVLVVGGISSGVVVASAEIYTP